MNVQWQGLAGSAFGERLVTPAYQTGIYISTNSGTSWRITSAPHINWQAVACSADASNIIASTGVLFTISPNHVGPIYTSTNGGATWNLTDAPTNTWVSVASSADGHKFVAVALGGGIYTLQSPPTPVLNVTSAGNDSLLSWIIPSLTFRLQQTSDLAGNKWTDVTAGPDINPTNLQYQLTIPTASNPHTFYKLVSP
jgi:hypothetical protein